LYTLHCLISRKHSNNTEFRKLAQSPVSKNGRRWLVRPVR
jgi:hypothetical protein